MIINNKLSLKAAICAASAVAMSGSALAYDAFTESGAIPTEIHTWMSIFPPLGDPNCGVLCGLLGGIGEFNIIMRVQNATAGFTGGVANATIDNYVGTNETASSGALPIFLHYDIYSPSIDLEYLYTYNPTVADDAQQYVPFDWNFTTSVEGKITTGYVTVADLQATIPIFTTYDFDERLEFDVSSCATDGSGNPIAPTITALRGIDATDLAGTNAGDRMYCIRKQRPISYLTCDTLNECGQFGKSVTVAAFATGMLSLGLLSVAFVTRRQHKSA